VAKNRVTEQSATAMGRGRRSAKTVGKNEEARE